MARGVHIGLAHQDRDLAAGIADARRPPFAAVDDVVIAVLVDARLDIGGIGRRHGRLGHQEGGADLAVHQRAQPFALLLLGAVAHEHFHVAGVGRRAVEYFGGPADVAHFLRERRVFEIAQSRAAKFVVLMRVRRHEHVPEALRAGFLLQVFENRNDLPARTFGVLLLVDRHRGADMLGHEGLHPAEPFLLPVRHREIHETLLTCSSKILLHCLSAMRVPQEPLWGWRARHDRSVTDRKCPAREMRIDFPAVKTIVSYKCLKCKQASHSGAARRAELWCAMAHLRIWRLWREISGSMLRIAPE